MPTSIYVRRKQEGGNWRYERVVEIRGRKTGDIAGPFFSRPCIKGKQTWHDLQAAKTLNGGSSMGVRLSSLVALLSLPALTAPAWARNQTADISLNKPRRDRRHISPTRQVSHRRLRRGHRGEIHPRR